MRLKLVNPKASVETSRRSRHALNAVGAEDKFDSNDHWLFELVPRLMRLQDMALRDIKPSITFGQFRLLERVSEGRDTLTAIAQASTLALPTISERIEVAVKKGLLRRKSSPVDGRAWILILTKKGEATMLQASKRLQALHQWMLGSYDSNSYRVFRRTGIELDQRLILLLRDIERGKLNFSKAIGSKRDSEVRD